MPKNSSVTILKRWLEMDALLGNYGLSVSSFARRWNVSEKTIRRDIAAFRAIGQRIVCRRADDEVDIYRHFYERGVKPLFYDNGEGQRGS